MTRKVEAEQVVTSFAPDQAVAEWFLTHSAANPLLVDAGEVLAVVLHPWTFRAAVVAAAVLAWRAGHQRAARVCVVVMAAGGVLGGVLKLVVQRPRPAWADPLAAETGYSMPSGHALNAALGCALVVVLAWPWLRTRGRAAAVAAAAAVTGVTAADRAVLGVHYLSDVLAGALLGTVLAAGAAVILRGGRLPAVRAEALRHRDELLR